MKRAVFDTSAMMALMLNEPGADIVEQHLDGAMLSSVSLAEVGAKMVDKGATLDLVETEIRMAGVEVVAFDDVQALGSARLRLATKEKGLSLGDRACLALGAEKDRIVLTADHPWGELDLQVDIRLIR